MYDAMDCVSSCDAMDNVGIFVSDALINENLASLLNVSFGAVSIFVGDAWDEYFAPLNISYDNVTNFVGDTLMNEYFASLLTVSFGGVSIFVGDADDNGAIDDVLMVFVWDFGDAKYNIRMTSMFLSVAK